MAVPLWMHSVSDVQEKGDEIQVTCVVSFSNGGNEVAVKQVLLSWLESKTAVLADFRPPLKAIPTAGGLINSPVKCLIVDAKGAPEFCGLPLEEWRKRVRGGWLKIEMPPPTTGEAVRM